jgi:autotransporter-associated beta strand protein
MNKPTPAIVISILICTIQLSLGGSATWNANPNSGYWGDANNWTPATVPKDPVDTATFDVSTITSLDQMVLTVGSVVFNPGANAYVLNPFDTYKSTMSGVGIINNSGILQTLELPAVPQFVGDEEWGNNLFTLSGNATAGTMIQYNVHGSSCGDGKTDDSAILTFEGETTAGGATFVTFPGTIGFYQCRGEGGFVDFVDSSSAENATLISNGGTIIDNKEAGVSFDDNSTAANATVTSYGGTVSRANGGYASFYGEATAGNATLISNAGLFRGARAGETLFFLTSTAENATLIANGGEGDGGLIEFADDSTGGTAHVQLFGNGNLDISLHNAPGVTIGSLEGDGVVFLGAQNLTVGSSNTKTLFSGLIRYGGLNRGGSGSLTKIGTGNLTLTGANIYTGGTTINGGTLLVNNTAGSGLGTGPVRVTTGILGGTGIISGKVAIGVDNGLGAVLGPGGDPHTPGTLTIESSLTLRADATYRVTLNSSIASADTVVAKGVRISQAQIILSDLGSGTLPSGTVFTVINNTSANPITGTFANLADGGTITVGSNTFQADYEGDDGNDLTLTVVP